MKSLQKDLRDQWTTKKATQDPSVAQEFEIRYIQAFQEKLEESRQRHRRRNAKRRRLGLVTTPFYFRNERYPDSDDETYTKGDTPNCEAEIEQATPSSDAAESQEAEEDNSIDHQASDALLLSKSSSSVKPQERSRPPNRVFTYDPDKAAPEKSKTAATATGKEAQVTKSSKAPGSLSSSKLPKQAKLDRLPSRARDLRVSTEYSGTAQKSSSTPQAPAPSRSGNVSTTIAAVPTTNVGKKSLTAKKSGQAVVKKSAQAAVNVFSEGKKPKQRRSVGVDEIDHNKEQKLYDRVSWRRKSELRSRARNDQAPDITRVAQGLFAPGFNPGSRTQPSQEEQAPRDVAPRDAAPRDVDGDEGAHSTIPEEAPRRSLTMTLSTSVGSAASGPAKSALSKRSWSSSDVTRPKKKAKSVRFTGADDEPETRESRSVRFPGGDERFVRVANSDSPIGDDPIFVSEPMEIDDSTGFTNETAAQTTAQSAEDSLGNLQSVNKKIMLSTASTQILDVTFEAVPREPSQFELAVRRSLEAFIDIDCLRIGHTVQVETLSSQLPTIPFHHLCSGSITSAGGLLEVIAEHLRIKCSGLFVTHEQFNLVMFPTKCEMFNLEAYGLKPTDSSDGIAFTYLLFRSSEHPIARLIRPNSGVHEKLQLGRGAEKSVLFAKILNLRFSQLTAGPADRKKKFFFLAFPERSMDWCRSICSWLSMRDPRCEIFTSFGSGGWSAFIERANSECGIVILHEAAVPLVRRFPSVARLLQSHNINFWRMSESLSLQQIQSSVPKVTSVIPTMFSRLFPAGKVFLITPSFMVSQPQETVKFFKWFFDGPHLASYHKLVTTYNLVDYLRDLADEKCAEQASVKLDRWNRMSQLDVAIQKNAGALTDQDLEARQKAWLYVDIWLAQIPQIDIPFSEDCRLIRADRSIDPHDEQSLVNWFGWWSLEHCDEYQKFYVVGSDAPKDASPMQASRVSRNIKPPKYGRSVVNDPDEAFRVTLKHDEPVEAVNAGPQLQNGTFWFQSRYFSNDESNIKAGLITLNRGWHTKFHHTPVSWADVAMAEFFGDPLMEFATIEQWWRGALPWLGDPGNHFSTYVGFFYTIQSDWDPAAFREGLKPRRHPWLAVYRPVNPHDKRMEFKHGRTELIIWDTRAGDKFEHSHSIGLTDLTWMQQQLVHFIQLHAHEKNPGSFLERVWLGGFQKHQQQCGSTGPADITWDFLIKMYGDLKHTIPGFEKFLTNNGYRPVSLSPHESQDESDEDPDTRIIFHPPRGVGQLKPGTSKCTNDLFKAARLHGLHTPKSEKMTFTYRPTMEWYRDQVAEGRQFEHISIDAWHKLFDHLKIDKSDAPPK